MTQDEVKDKWLVGDIASYLHCTFANDEQIFSQITDDRKEYYRDIARNIIVKVRLNTPHQEVQNDKETLEEKESRLLLP